jgi:endonuclease/exonuclease/phosphatase family metal-dependent hydrolase
MPKPLLRRFTKSLLVIINLVVSFLFVGGNLTTYFDPEKFWFLGVLALCMPYFLGLLIFFAIVWLLARSFWIFLALLPIAFFITDVRNIIPFRLNSHFNNVKKPGNLRVMSWNVAQFNLVHRKEQPAVKQQMIDLINTYNPDIASFQEMVSGDDESAINNTAAIKAALKFRYYFYSYDRRNDFDKDHHFGVIIFSKYPFIRQQTVSYYPYDYNSTFQYADIKINTNTFRIFNIHLQSLRLNQNIRNYLDEPQLSLDTNLSQSRSILGKLKYGFLHRSHQARVVKKELNKSPYINVVCGDFNDVPNSFAYKTIGENLNNAFVKKGAGISRTFYEISPTLRIDNIFTDKRIEVLQFTRIKHKLSDHFPIIADMKMKDQQP